MFNEKGEKNTAVLIIMEKFLPVKVFYDDRFYTLYHCIEKSESESRKKNFSIHIFEAYTVQKI